MGCFLACFGGTKDRKQRRRPKKSLPTNRINENYQALLTSPSPQKSVIKVKADVVVPELRENKENQEQGSFDSCRKKVTFDLNIKTYENFKDPSEDEEVKELKQEVNEETEGKVKELKQEVKEETEGKVNPISSYRYQNCDGSDDECIDDELEEELDEEVKELKQEIKEETEGKVSPVSNYRYQNCDGSDNECIDDELEEELDDTDFEDEDDDIDVVVTEEESCESFFSLPMDKEKQLQCCQEADSPVPVSILDKGSTLDRSQYVHSVLNPVENLSQWKEVKARALPMKKLNKDNITSVTPKTSKSSNNENSNSESETKVISVDASLSTWLVLSENSPKEEPQRSNSSISREDKPVLGALTVEDLKPSVTSSPRTPSRNPDDIPILGTVGSYWSRDQNSDVKGIPNTTSKYREDKRVNWHSTPFEVRLERALNIGAAEA